jgi:hypothetical protein
LHIVFFNPVLRGKFFIWGTNLIKGYNSKDIIQV